MGKREKKEKRGEEGEGESGGKREVMKEGQHKLLRCESVPTKGRKDGKDRY